ncbi:UdgX family uracil-DNA binding protein [Sphingomonas sp. TX0543]|uniref:UdgX family uracil-DNA binding protein n=1 Tax=unclassified Sphingomonas TaxID=196159 RepID=UPI0010F67880|nr:UdgX family uracil-DNA binding protein [Sphingomonas sp. 3P27F8]
MHRVTLTSEDDFDGWREAVRKLVAADVPPEQVVWVVGSETGELFGEENVVSAAEPVKLSVPRAFMDLARFAILNGDRERFALLHALLWRLARKSIGIGDRTDPLIGRIEGLATAVRRDIHKMRAFLRFREVEDHGGVRHVAWHEPEHHIVRANAAFFVDRFAAMRWSILTPRLSIHWDGTRLFEGPAARRADAPSADQAEEMWKTYYASIFNPARVKIGAMLNEMPRKYWKNMPETALIPELIAGAQAREATMVTNARSKPVADPAATWAKLRDEAADCRRCDLHRCASRTVFGEGPSDAAMMFVGEQPGDQEDLAGRPFVGPAGQIFDRALAESGIDRTAAYVTNAVKHFKFELRGKRRIHERPNAGEIAACRWWIEQELALVRPRITVALGATAARSLFGTAVTVSSARGALRQLPDGGAAVVTVHPSFLLRLPDEARRIEEYDKFVADLRNAACAMKALPAST